MYELILVVLELIIYFLSYFVFVWVWEQFLKNGFLLALIAVVYLQQWLKNKLEYVQCAKAGIGILFTPSALATFECFQYTLSFILQYL
jgi:hypothetical protein